MSGAKTWAIVPVKTLANAKQRLAGVLPAEARRRLMLAMLDDVLATLRQVEALQTVLVVTPEAEVADIALSHGARVLREARSTGHSAAAIAGFAEARTNGAIRAVSIPADAPFITAEELCTLLATDGKHTLTFVPSRDGDGTNAILVSPPDAFAPSFGFGSFARHRAQAAAAGIAYRTLELPGLGLDIDEPRDLRDLMQRTRGNPRYAFLARHVLALAQAGDA